MLRVMQIRWSFLAFLHLKKPMAYESEFVRSSFVHPINVQ